MCLELMSEMILYVYMLQKLHYYIKYAFNLRPVANQFFEASAD